MDRSITFEAAIKRLEEIVGELEGGDIEIERALILFEEGTKLARVCQKKLSNVERRIEILKKGEGGNDVLDLFADIDDV
ncbi:MAG TPA: exodeoxyribonuclease VII small subunit [Spirochaetota bacterium]|nr:exodeoxyribonuclease VII small subunit [Spirochaetota bacterium]